MPCQHLTQIQELKLPVSDAEALKVLCPICGQVEVCAYTPVGYADAESSSETKAKDDSNAPSQGSSPGGSSHARQESSDSQSS